MKFLIQLFFFISLISIHCFSQADSIKNIMVADRQINTESVLSLKTSVSYPISPERKFNIMVPDPLDTKIDYGILAGFGAVVAGSFAVIHNDFKNTWWKKDSLYRGEFHFMNDWDYALSVDKIGHMYATHLLAHGLSGAFDAANFNPEQSAWYSASLALIYELYVETEDGYAYPKWGFSPGDAIGDVLGATFYVSQYYFPYLKNFQLRWSYYPSKAMRNGTHKGNISDDYEGQIYWLSARVKNIFPENIAEYWPSFLNLSFGYGARNLDGAGGGQRHFYLSFDFDFEELPLHGAWWNFVKNSLNYAHLPMPGIQFSPDTKLLLFTF